MLFISYGYFVVCFTILSIYKLLTAIFMIFAVVSFFCYKLLYKKAKNEKKKIAFGVIFIPPQILHK